MKLNPQGAKEYMRNAADLGIAYYEKLALETVAELQEEWGVMDAYGEIVWFCQEGETKKDAEEYAELDKEFVLVPRYVSQPIMSAPKDDQDLED